MHLVYIDEVKCDKAQEPYYWLCVRLFSTTVMVYFTLCRWGRGLEWVRMRGTTAA